ncbi:MAG: YraN family protein [Deltaproteobacteria bacterium]|nr:YraN family protein [Deltaproteobacteria bacterium]
MSDSGIREQKSTSGYRKQELGRVGEQLAMELLESKGYDLVAKNWRGRIGELDLVVSGHGVLVFVEVRTLKADDFDDPLASIGPSKIRQVSRTAREYLSRNPPPKDVDLRFDVVGVTLTDGSGAKIEHIKGAFEVPGDLF